MTTNKSKKSFYFIKQNVEFEEYLIHKLVYNLEIVNVPKIIKYDKDTKILTLQKITNDCLSNIYGENANCVPKEIFSKVRNIITQLYYHHIDYVDITGYNFMEDKNGKIWIIDFGHAKCRDLYSKSDPFIIDFTNGLDEWNPEFK